ncbi:MAG: polymorphic toxin type 28 domain-containing protein [Propionibacteriaceae bacterium]|nr:polymorphic toxin type 28 domain-containing protein [Propionibacteriaceae bacterium]
MAELGETSDPVELVPGNVSVIVSRMYDLGDYAQSLGDAGSGLTRIDTSECWQGEAAEAFREHYQGEPKRWVVAGDSFAKAAKALDDYSWTLKWAQDQAASAIDEWARGVARTEADKKAYEDAVQQAESEAAKTGVPVVIAAFVDGGEPIRQGARDVLTEARRQLADVANDTAATIQAACEAAPAKPTWLDSAIDGLGWFGGKAEDAGIAAVNGIVSFGNAMWNHPGDMVGLLSGLGMVLAGGGGDAGGGVLDATGVGAVVGIPVNIASTGLIVGGAGVTAAAATALVSHAATDNRVQILQKEASQPEPGASGRHGTPTDGYKEQVDPPTLDAARRELNGEVVKINPRDSEPYDHVQKVRNAQNGLEDRIDELKRKIGDSRSSQADRAAAQKELSEAAKLLENSKRWVPRPPK